MPGDTTMRLPFLLIACLAAAPVAAQDRVPADAPVAAAEPAAPPTCNDLRAAAQREHDESERARIAANDDGVRFAFFYECPTAEMTGAERASRNLAASERLRGQGEVGVTADTGAATWSLPVAGSNTAFVTRRVPPARTETAEEFYNRPRAAAGSVAFDQAVAEREGGYSRSASAELGNGTIQNESSYRCTETAFEQTCTSEGTVTFSSGDDDGAAARALLDSLRRPD